MAHPRSWAVLLAVGVATACASEDRPPDVTLLVGFFPPGMAPPGFHEAKAKVSRGRATITIGATTLEYDAVHDQYQAHLPDLDFVDVSVAAEGLRLTGELIRRARDVTCTISAPDVVHWGFGSSAEWSWDTDWTPGTAGIGFVDPADIDGPLFWPAPATAGHLVEEQSFKKPENTGSGELDYRTSIPALARPDHPVDHLWLVAEGVDSVGILSGGADVGWGIANLCARSVPVSSVSLDSISIEGRRDYPFNRGVVGRFQVIAWFSDGTSADVTETATWTSSDESILFVRGGQVTVAGVGNVEITATVAGVSATVPVVVGSATLLQLVVTPTWAPPSDRVVVPIGFQGQLQAVAYFSGGWQPDVSGEVSWTPRHSAIVSVDATGHLTANGPGTVGVTASLDGLVGSIGVEVRN